MRTSFAAPIIIAVGLVLAGIAYALVGAVMQVEDGAAVVKLNRAEVELGAVYDQLQDAQDALREAELEMQALRAALVTAEENAQRARVTATAPTGLTGVDQIEIHDDTVAMTEQMQLARDQFNTGITQPRNRVMLEILGQPRQQYGVNCQSVTNANLRGLLETRQVGPIRVTMIRPALESLERIMGRLQEEEPDIYAAMGTAGALCVRLIRGSSSGISNHSWGTAIDLKLEGRLDGFGDGSTQFGLLLVAELFNEEGWFWGATYSREDSMHFEVGVETLRAWAAAGEL